MVTYAGIYKRFGYLKTKEDNLDIDNFKNVPADLNKLSTVVDKNVVKKFLYDLLVVKFSGIDSEIPSISHKNTI